MTQRTDAPQYRQDLIDKAQALPSRDDLQSLVKLPGDNETHIANLETAYTNARMIISGLIHALRKPTAPVSETGDRNVALEEAALFVETRELLFARTRAEGGTEGAREVDDIKEYLVRGIRGLKRALKTSAATAAPSSTEPAKNHATLAESSACPVAWWHEDFGVVELSRIQRPGWKPLYSTPPSAMGDTKLIFRLKAEIAKHEAVRGEQQMGSKEILLRDAVAALTEQIAPTAVRGFLMTDVAENVDDADRVRMDQARDAARLVAFQEGVDAVKTTQKDSIDAWWKAAKECGGCVSHQDGWTMIATDDLEKLRWAQDADRVRDAARAELLAIHEAVMNPQDIAIMEFDTFTVKMVKEFVLGHATLADIQPRWISASTPPEDRGWYGILDSQNTPGTAIWMPGQGWIHKAVLPIKEWCRIPKLGSADGTAKV